MIEKGFESYLSLVRFRVLLLKGGVTVSGSMDENEKPGTENGKIRQYIVEGGDISNVVENLKELVKDFTTRRNWEPYHNPKDLAISISIEAAELLEVVQWRKHTKEELLEYHDFLPRVREELADVLIYCIGLSNVLELDISEIVREKIKVNEEKYPVGSDELRF